MSMNGFSFSLFCSGGGSVGFSLHIVNKSNRRWHVTISFVKIIKCWASGLVEGGCWQLCVFLGMISEATSLKLICKSNTTNLKFICCKSSLLTPWFLNTTKCQKILLNEQTGYLFLQLGYAHINSTSFMSHVPHCVIIVSVCALLNGLYGWCYADAWKKEAKLHTLCISAEQSLQGEATW